MKVKVQNPQFNRPGIWMFEQPEYFEYEGEEVQVKWLMPNQIALSTGNPEFPFRVINKSQIISINNKAMTQKDTSVKTFTVKGSKGDTYTVTVSSGKMHCTCSGFQFRKRGNTFRELTMLKKLAYSTLVLVALSGCATHQQANTAVGAGTGAVIGNAIGGRGGAAVGALIGASIGGQQPTQHNRGVYVERQIIVPDRAYQCQRYIDQERNCWNMRYQDTRAMCIEESRNRYQNCMHH